MQLFTCKNGDSRCAHEFNLLLFPRSVSIFKKNVGKVTILLSNRLPEEFNGTIFDKNKINLSKTIERNFFVRHKLQF